MAFFFLSEVVGGGLRASGLAYTAYVIPFFLITSAFFEMSLLPWPTSKIVPVQKVKWEPTLAEALLQAEEEQRPVLISMGMVGEARSQAHLKEIYGNKKLAPFLAQSLNVAAWKFSEEDEKKLPKFGKTSAENHHGNLAGVLGNWVEENELDQIPLPNHIWLGPGGEVILSCPWELSEAEMIWCYEEALHRIHPKTSRANSKGSYPPRRLMIEDTWRVKKDSWGRGLKPQELKDLIGRLSKRPLTAKDARDIGKIMQTVNLDGVKFLDQQMALWGNFGGEAVAPIIDGTLDGIGSISPEIYLDVLERYSEHARAGARASAAAAIEQMGHAAGLSIARKALRDEEDMVALGEWARALGACGRGNKTVARTLAKMAEKHKNPWVRQSAILGLGHVLPEPTAKKFLLRVVQDGQRDDRRAAVLALALGRQVDARELIAEIGKVKVGAEDRGYINQALLVLEGGNLYEIEEQVGEVSGSGIGRPRLFFKNEKD